MATLTASMGDASIHHSPLSNRSTGFDQPPLMAPPPFTLTPVKLTAPTANKPLKVSFTTGGSHNRNPIFPATKLQLSFLSSCGAESFPASSFTVKDIESSGDGVYTVVFPASEVPKVPVSQGSDTSAEVRMYAWKRDKLLGDWMVGKVKNVGYWKK